MNEKGASKETTNEQGYLVAKSWLEDMERRTTPNKEPEPERRSSLFYDLRPAQLSNSWTQNAAGL